MLIGMDFLAVHNAKIDLSNDPNYPASLVLPHPAAAGGQITARLISRPATLIEGRVSICDLLTSEPDLPVSHVTATTDATAPDPHVVIEASRLGNNS